MLRLLITGLAAGLVFGALTAAGQSALNVSTHAAETSIETLTGVYLPLLLQTATAISADWTLRQSRPEISAGAGW